LLVTRNDYQLRLFNGDIGIVHLDRSDSEHRSVKRVFFHSERGPSRKILPMLLPEHETAYAMTVHKSQGSEFDRVILILPQKQAPVLTRELIYTGITRAMRRVEVWGSRSLFLEAAGCRIGRASGLGDALWRLAPE
jgi:exodeoxyribonuclease V alpha subunit